MDTASALARVLSEKVSAATTRTARGTVVAVGTDGTVTFTVGGLPTPRKGVWVGFQPQIGEVITYLDEGRGIPLVWGATGVRDLYVPATKSLIVGNTTVNTAGVTTTGGAFVDAGGNLRSAITALLPTAWTDVAFGNGWSNFTGSGDTRTQYRKVGDDVQVRGAMASGTVPATAFVLPSGFRPFAREIFTVYSGGAVGRVDVGANGALSVEVGNTANVFLGRITFSINA